MSALCSIKQLALGIGALVLVNAFGTLPAYAIAITINDLGETITATPGFGLTLTQEGIGILGDASYHFEYVSTDPNIPGNGVARTFNVNWWEDFVGGSMSDTLGITITGHITTTSNVSVDLSFLSGSSDDSVLPAPFAGGNTFIRADPERKESC